MNKKEMIKVISDETNVDKDTVNKIFDSIFNLFKNELNRGEDVIVTGFGGFRTVERKKRIGLNLSTGEQIEVSPRRVVTFRPGVPLKKYINENIEK